MADNEDDIDNRWLIAPANNLVQFLVNEMVVAGVTKRVMHAAQGLPKYLAFIHIHTKDKDKKLADAVQDLLKSAIDDAEFARKETESGYSTILAHHLVAAWSAVENAVDQVLQNHLMKLQNAAKIICQINTDINESRLQSLIAKNTRRALSYWEQAISDPSVTNRMVIMLRTFDITINIDKNTHRHLDEMNEIRNTILHKGGYIDRHFIEKCSWLNYNIGDMIKIKDESMGLYFDMAGIFAQELIGGLTKSPYIKTNLPFIKSKIS